MAISKTTHELYSIAYSEILGAINDGYYTSDDLENINFSEICDWCGFPDNQDWGIYEQCIDAAIESLKSLILISEKFKQ